MTFENSRSDQNSNCKQSTVLPLSATVRLVRCDNEDCNCGFNVHCPFCDKVHFKPTTVKKVRDHLEFRHFAYAVQFSDVTVVKCFKTCKEKASGHYHCPICTSMLLKRNAFVEHLRKHAKVMGKGIEAVVAFNSKHPKKVSVIGHTIILCDKACSESKHYHCPLCEHIDNDRSLLITHIWRCEENKGKNKKLPRFDINQDEEFNLNFDVSHPKEAKTEVQHWHQSIVRNMKDLPIQKCTEANCCDGKFHCPLCTKERFKPTFYNHLIRHYVAHWKKRIPYNNYNILICTENCELTHERMNKSIMYHYHCPLCGETKRRRASFIHHLKICQGDRYLTHRYSMKRIEHNTEATEHSKEVHFVTTTEDHGVEENVQNIVTTIYEGDSNIFTKESEDRDMFNSEETKHMIIEKLFTENVISDDTVVNTDVSCIDEVFHTVTAVLSWDFLQKISLNHETLDNILENISKCSETSISSSPGTINPVYIVSGQPENLIKFKDLLKKVAQGEKKENCNKGLPLEDVAEIRSETPEADFEKSSVNNHSSLDTSILLSQTENNVEDNTSCITKREFERPRKMQQECIQMTTTENNNMENQNSYKRSLRFSDRKTRVDFSAMVKGEKKLKDVLQKQNRKELVNKTTEKDINSSHMKKSDKKIRQNARKEDFVEPLSSKHSQTDLTESENEDCDFKDESANSEVNSSDQTMYVPSVLIDEVKPGTLTSHSKDNLKKNNMLSVNENDYNGIMQDNNLSYNCNICKFNGDCFISLKNHYAECHRDMEQIKCDLCRLFFTKQSDLQSHLSLVHGPKELHQSFLCKMCDKAFKSEKSLTIHFSKVHQTSKFKDCAVRLFDSNTSKVDLDTGIDLKHVDTPVCEICGKIFSQQQHLLIHMQAVHLKSKKAICDLCGKHFDHIRYLKAHMKRHAGIKKHVCNQCSLSFLESNSLRLHMETHLDPEQRSYKIICKFCGKKFASKTNYKDHINKHTGDKPYECNLCGRRFGFKSMIEKHKLFKHSTERPFKCTNCPKAFKMKRLLDQHMVTHTRESKFTCYYCNKPFSCKNTMKIHISKCKAGKWTQKIPNSTHTKTNLLYADKFISLNQSNEEGIVLNSVVPIETDAKTDLITVSSEVESEQTSKEPEIIMGTENVIVKSNSVVLRTTENIVIDGGNIPIEATDIALFLCSGCNAIFENWNMAEQHISMCHTENMEDIMQVSSDDVQGQAVDIITTVVQE